MFQVNQPMKLTVAGVPSRARTKLTITAPGGATTVRDGFIGAQAQATFTPDAIGTWGHVWEALDGGGVVVGTASGTFDVVAPSVVAMTATVGEA